MLHSVPVPFHFSPPSCSLLCLRHLYRLFLLPLFLRVLPQFSLPCSFVVFRSLSFLFLPFPSFLLPWLFSSPPCCFPCSSSSLSLLLCSLYPSFRLFLSVLLVLLFPPHQSYISFLAVPLVHFSLRCLCVLLLVQHTAPSLFSGYQPLVPLPTQ